MIAAAVAQFLDSELEPLTYTPAGVGGNVFVDWMPDQPDIAVAVMTRPGSPNLTKLPGETVGVQILVRHTSIRAADDLADLIFDALACAPAQVLDEGGPDEVQVIGVTPGSHSPIGRDVKERPEWSLNFTLRIHNPTSHRPAVTA